MHADERAAPTDGSPGTATAVERYLHQQIPISAGMGVRVRLATPERVDLWLPLQPNINHEQTVFGGSAAAAATLAAWTLLHLRLTQAGSEAQLVVQRTTMEYTKPIDGDFEATCTFSDAEAWGRFRRTLERRGKARLGMTAHLLGGSAELGAGRSRDVCAAFAGDFVALRSAPTSRGPQ
jgi:thioesterase domain-containing protein